MVNQQARHKGAYKIGTGRTNGKPAKRPPELIGSDRGTAHLALQCDRCGSSRTPRQQGGQAQHGKDWKSHRQTRSNRAIDLP